MNNEFQFRHFVPTDGLVDLANSILKEQTRYHQGGSFPLAMLSKINKRYYCCLTFHFNSKEFFADSFSSDPEEALARAEEILYFKLTDFCKVNETLRTDWSVNL